MIEARPFVLSIAGFDPSSGAGITADIKTFESLNVYGLGVCSAITFQNENQFDDVEWTSSSGLKRQLDVLFRKYDIAIAKIGLIKDLTTLHDIVDYLVEKHKDIRIIWDPILKASAGFSFHNSIQDALCKKILDKIFIVTPNIPEVISLANHRNDDEFASALFLSRHCLVYLKAGHSKTNDYDDWLFTPEGGRRIAGKQIIDGEKHGSGCVLSSAIAANLAKGLSIVEASKQARNYINHFLSSNKTLLGYHSIAITNEINQ